MMCFTGRERGRDLVHDGLGVTLEADEVAAHAGLDVAVLPPDAVVIGSSLDFGHVLEDGEELGSDVPVAVRDGPLIPRLCHVDADHGHVGIELLDGGRVGKLDLNLVHLVLVELLRLLVIGFAALEGREHGHVVASHARIARKVPWRGSRSKRNFRVRFEQG